ncbi:hypothetical protein I8752_05115 [Nostocaceae cyanobacterium CENA369]|uniref:Uncharacterized protein n=1 Tax=Dendronalium phyllosphericum CENA369 TaxID=1725256 RepID=A0A8J7I2G4_9NOST|nr:hypothetical protein [Dendronalium phyllosphericum]MBH8572423.1 hypothetical protein [Dendronalium phyllosphericum CENA369]
MTGRIVEQGKIVDVGVSSFKDPANSAGLYIASSSLYQTYRVDRNRVKQICERLYQHLIEKVSNQNLGDARFRIVTYREDSTGFSQVSAKEYDNQERTYILITRDTLRSTRATILVRFLTYGENLYVGVGTYVLGKLNLCAFIRKIILTLIIPWFAIAPLSFFPGINQLLFLLYLCLIAFSWAGLVQRIIEVGDIKTALRLEFNKALDLGSFNLDDVVMFLKSTLHTTVTSIRDVLKQEGLPVETLDAFVQNINNNINQNFTGPVGGVTGTGVVKVNPLT